MGRLIALMLLVGALTGLFGAQMAYAYAGPSPVAAEKPMAMADHDMTGMDCAEMMAPAKPQLPQDGTQPCKGMTLACIAQMGCTLALVLRGGPEPTAVAAAVPIVFALPPAPPLAGRSYAPEPEPPTLLI